MKSSHIFVIILVLVFILFLAPKMSENFFSNTSFNYGSFDITPSITVDMDWKNSQVSNFAFYPNNLSNASEKTAEQIKKLQSYQPKLDGHTDSLYVKKLEGFTMMNPFIDE